MLTIRQKMGYGLGDLASNIVFQIAANFMLFYYTDVVGIAAGAAGTMMLAVRILDAFTDPVMGAIADRTRTRWGTYRPYLIWMAVPYGILAILAFSVPETSDKGKLLYAYVTYSLLMIVYTAINIPYSALGGVLSENSKDRSSVQAWRFVGAMTGNFIILLGLLALVDFFGGDNQAKGFQYGVTVMAFLAVICFVLCFMATKEAVEVPKNVVKTGIAEDAFSLFRNDQFLIIAAIAIFLLILVGCRSAVGPHYVKYYLGLESINVIWFKLNATSFYLMSGAFASLIGALFTDWASKIAAKKTLFLITSLGVAVFHLVLFFIPGEAFYLSFTFFLLANFCQMVMTPIMFAMVADTVDYGALKTGKKIMGMTFSGHLLAIKLGFALGAGVAGWVLGAYGFVANVDQSESGIMGIMMTFALIPALCGFVVVGFMLFYKLTEEKLDEIHVELHRDEAGVAQPGFHSNDK